ncbi:MAG: HlyC/CorC family transporter [Sphingomonadales bacterium]|nr:HlyC/CorC family transporter [Sphingomonadales bacterium]
MDTEILIGLSAIFVLLAFSAFFSGSETALTAASKARINRMAKDQPRARKVAKLIDDKERLIGGILLGNNLVNILASALATSLMIAFFGDDGVVYATLIMTALVVVFAEVLPKTYAIQNPDRMSMMVAPLINVLVIIFAPITKLIQKLVRGTLHLFGIDISGNVLSAEEEIRGTIDLHASEGEIEKPHRDMLGSILDLDEVVLEDVMVHRKNMVMMDVNLSPEEIVKKVTTSPYTRIPVWEKNSENIVGILHAKDVLRTLMNKGVTAQTFNVRDVMIRPWFVPETTTLREQLDAFLKQRAHFALVVDEYGALMGLVTLEDILEEIVGDITDEHDFLIEGVEEASDGSLLVDGTVTIRDLNRQFDWNLPDDDAVTIAGLLINEAKVLPIAGEQFAFFGYAFEVIGRRRNQITQLRIKAPKKQKD